MSDIVRVNSTKIVNAVIDIFTDPAFQGTVRFFILLFIIYFYFWRGWLVGWLCLYMDVVLFGMYRCQ